MFWEQTKYAMYAILCMRVTCVIKQNRTVCPSNVTRPLFTAKLKPDTVKTHYKWMRIPIASRQQTQQFYWTAYNNNLWKWSIMHFLPKEFGLLNVCRITRLQSKHVTHMKGCVDQTRNTLPSFLLIFLLKKLFDFLRFAKIRDHRSLIIIQPKPDVFANLSIKEETT